MRMKVNVLVCIAFCCTYVCAALAAASLESEGSDAKRVCLDSGYVIGGEEDFDFLLDLSRSGYNFLDQRLPSLTEGDKMPMNLAMNVDQNVVRSDDLGAVPQVCLPDLTHDEQSAQGTSNDVHTSTTLPPSSIKKFFMCPKYHNDYDYRAYYMAEDWSLVYLYLKCLPDKARRMMDYGIEQRAYLLDALNEETQLAQSWHFTYSKSIVCSLGLSVDIRSLQFNFSSYDNSHIAYRLYVEKDGDLMSEKNNANACSVMKNVDHLVYNQDRRELGVCMRHDVKRCIPVRWQLEEDRVVVYNPASPNDILFVFNTERPEEFLDRLGTNSFFKSTLPKLKGITPSINFFNNRIVATYQDITQGVEWVVGHSTKADSGVLMHGKIIPKRKTGQHYPGKICSFNMPYFIEKQGVMKIHMEDFYLKACITKWIVDYSSITLERIAQNTRKIYAKCKTHVSVLSAIRSICTHYTREGVELVAIADNGYMRIHSEGGSPLQVAFDAVKDFDGSVVKRLLSYPTPVGLQNNIASSVCVVRDEIPEKENDEAQCCVVHTYKMYRYEDKFSFERPAKLMWKRSCIDTAEPVVIATVFEDVSCRKGDCLRFVFSVAKVLHHKKEFARGFQIFFELQNTVLLCESSGRKYGLGIVAVGQSGLSAYVNSAVFCTGQYELVVCINNVPTFKVGLSYTFHNPCHLCGGQIECTVSMGDIRCFSDLFNLTEIFNNTGLKSMLP